MNDTPLTDKEPKYWISGSDGMMAARVDFARDLERKLDKLNLWLDQTAYELSICRAALGIREHEKIPAQSAQAGSLLIDDGSIRRRIYADGAELAAVTAERDELREAISGRTVSCAQCEGQVAAQHRLEVATALLTRARNGPGVAMPYELYADIQDFLNAPL